MRRFSMEEGILLKKLLALPATHVALRCAFGMLFTLAVVLRVALYSVQTSDYTNFVSQWYDFMQTHGGFSALQYNFSNYNVPYLYLLLIATALPIPKLIAIKSISVLFDGVLGLFVYLIVRLKYRRSYAAIIAALVIAFAPTIFINSAAWGQCDAIYTSFCLGSLYFLFKGRPVWACVFFGLAFAFKLQAIFFLPVLLVLLLKKQMSIKALVLIPLIFLIMVAPAFIAGRDAASLLSIYTGQITTGGMGGFGGGDGTGQPNQGGPGRFNGGRSAQTGTQATGQFQGSGQFTGGGSGQAGGQGNGAGRAGGPPAGGGRGRGNGGNRGGFGNALSAPFTYNAPSFYQWLPNTVASYWKWVGIVLAGMVVLAVGFLLRVSKEPFTQTILLKVVLVFVLAIPFLLPEMHERYFFLADAFTVIYAFYFPRFFFIALIMQLSSLFSYAPYFLNRQIVGLPYIAVAVFVITTIACVDLVRTLYPHLRKPKKSALQDVAPIPADSAKNLA